MKTPRHAAAIAIVFPALLPLLTAAPPPAGPLMAFECRERLDRDWPRMLVTHRLEFAPGLLRPGEVHVTDAAGKDRPAQLCRVRRHADGSVAAARVSFNMKPPPVAVDPLRLRRSGEDPVERFPLRPRSWPWKVG